MLKTSKLVLAALLFGSAVLSVSGLNVINCGKAGSEEVSDECFAKDVIVCPGGGDCLIICNDDGGDDEGSCRGKVARCRAADNPDDPCTKVRTECKHGPSCSPLQIDCCDFPSL